MSALLYAVLVALVMVGGLWIGMAIGKLADAEHGRGWKDR